MAMWSEGTEDHLIIMTQERSVLYDGTKKHKAHAGMFTCLFVFYIMLHFFNHAFFLSWACLCFALWPNNPTLVSSVQRHTAKLHLRSTKAMVTAQLTI